MWYSLTLIAIVAALGLVSSTNTNSTYNSPALAGSSTTWSAWTTDCSACVPVTETTTQEVPGPTITETTTCYETITQRVPGPTITETTTCYETTTQEIPGPTITQTSTLTGPTTTETVMSETPGPTTTITSEIPGPTTTETSTEVSISTETSSIVSTVEIPGPTVTSTITSTTISSTTETVSSVETIRETSTITLSIPATTIISTSTITSTSEVISTVETPGPTITSTTTSAATTITTTSTVVSTSSIISTIETPGPTITSTTTLAATTVTSTSTLVTTSKIVSTVETPGPTITISTTLAATTLTSTRTVSVTGPTEVETETFSSIIKVTATQFNTVTSVLTLSSTISISVPAPAATITLTSLSATTVTNSALSGVVTCPSRIINPTYTPPTPLPSTYLWGCPPGKLCHPKREGCNFEQNPPADTYVCAPEECLPVAQLPPLDTWLNYENVNDTCAWLTPIDDYFNINPTFFGLDFDIFNVNGQPRCDTQSVHTSIVTACSVGTSTWLPWSSASTAAAPQITKRATLEEREIDKRAVVVASECYAVCDYAAAVYQSIGKVPALCSSDGQWSSAFARVTSCTSKYSATGVTSVASVLNDPILYCRSNPQKRYDLFGRAAFA